MKKMILVSAMSLMSLTAMAAGIPEGKYDLDPSHSKVGFEIAHLVISTVEGRFGTYTGEVNVGKKSDLSFNADIEVASIDTGIGDRDKHLKSADFFDAEKFPKITFKSKSVKGDKNLKITGDLTIHGVTKEVVLEGKYLGSVKDGYGNDRLAFQANTKIKRSDFGLKWNKLIEVGPTVGDEVSISLKVEAIKKK